MKESIEVLNDELHNKEAIIRSISSDTEVKLMKEREHYNNMKEDMQVIMMMVIVIVYIIRVEYQS